MSGTSESLIVVNREEATLALATSLSQALGVALHHSANGCIPSINSPYQLVVDTTCSSLWRKNGRHFARFDLDFSHPCLLTRLKTSGKTQPLAKSLGLHKPRVQPLSVYDLTAGFGRDALTLAYLGCHVHLVEQSPLIGHLLINALEQASEHILLGPLITERMSWQLANSQTVLRQLEPEDYPDAIYLDPMFPERRKSAKVKLAMQILQDLVPLPQSPEPILALALEKCTERVVVKRPQGAPYLENKKPSYSIENPSLRFDIYRPAGISGLGTV